MSINRGSSPARIRLEVNGILGPVGPTGATGATGPTGEAGSCLPGATGRGIHPSHGTTYGLRLFHHKNTINSPTSTWILGGITFTDGFTALVQIAGICGGGTGKRFATPGAPFQNKSFYTISGSTTGQLLFKTTTPEEFFNASKIYEAVPSADLQPDQYPQFYGITLSGINFVESTGEIKLYIQEQISELSAAGVTGQLVFVDVSENKLTLRGTSGANWNKNLNQLEYTTQISKEIYPFGWGGITYLYDNWIRVTGESDSLNSIIPNSILIGNTGASTVDSVYTNPITLVNTISTGSTFQKIQPILSVIQPGNNLRIPFLVQDYSTGKTANLLTGTNLGVTLGSCFISSIPDPRKKCIDFVSYSYCNSLGGSWDNEPCKQRDELLQEQTSCCLYDYETNGITCIDTWPQECLEFMGIVGNVKCSIYEGILNRCSDLPDMCFSCIIGKCCFKGKCISESEYDCLLNYPGAVWFGETC